MIVIEYLKHGNAYLGDSCYHLSLKLFLELLNGDLSFSLNGGKLLSLVLESGLDLFVDFLLGLEQSLNLVFHLFLL